MYAEIIIFGLNSHDLRIVFFIVFQPILVDNLFFLFQLLS